MKLKDVVYLLGFRPGAKTYGYEVRAFELPGEGRVEYAQWLHPRETAKRISQEAVDELRRFLAPGDVAIDVGAHTGDTTVAMAVAVGKTGCVLALEPNPYVFAVLKKNAELNREKTRIVPLPFAATPDDAEYEFTYSDAGFCNGGAHQGISRWRHGHAFRLKVQGRNLPAYLDNHHADLVPGIRFIKTDAEGYDHTVLTTLEGLISRQKPYIRAEIFKRTSRPQREAMYRFLAGYGYTIWRVRSEANLRGERTGLEDLTRWPHYDVFCEPPT